MSYPIEPTVFLPESYIFENEWYEKDFFHSPDGIQEFPNHHCKLTWLLSQPYVKHFRNAVDIGCRDGEYTRYLQEHFGHVYGFDPRFRKLFPRNIRKEKVTYFRCCVGNTICEYPRTDGNYGNPDWKDTIYPLDDFNLTNVDYIKIDTDGFEYDIIKGADKTIRTYQPLIVCEAQPDYRNQDRAIELLEEQYNYHVVAVCPRNIDRIMLPK